MDIFKHAGERLRAIRKARGLTQDQVAEGSSFAVTSVSGWENSGKLPKYGRLDELAEKLAVSRSFLTEGISTCKADQEILGKLGLSTSKRSNFSVVSEAARKHSNAKIDDRALVWVPVISWVSAGQAEKFEELPYDWQELIPVDCPDQHAFAIRLVGDSMEPEYREGEIAVVMPSHQPKNGCLVVARLKDDGVVFKRFFVENAEKQLLRLSSYNPVYPSQVYPESAFSWIYPVWSVQRKVW